MSIVKRENIPLLHSIDPAFFARWLIGGLETLHTTGRGFAGFRGATAFVGATDDTSEDLRDIHDCLNPDERTAFRAGVARALGCTVQLLTDRAAINICNTLLFLAQRLEADDVLDVLPGFASHVFGLPRTDELDELMDRVLRTASEVVTPGRRAGDCLRTIIGLRRFRPSLAYPAMIALCKAEPGEFGDHLFRLHGSLNKAFGYTEDRDELARRKTERRSLIAEVFDIVPSDEFFRASSGALAPPQRRENTIAWNVFTDWWRDDSFLLPEVVTKFQEHLSQGLFSPVDEDDLESAAPYESDAAMAASDYNLSPRERMNLKAQAAEEAMPGIARVPASAEDADYSLVAEAA